VGTRQKNTSLLIMKKLLLTTALLAAGSLCLESTSFGHGGTYRGPGDTVPPGGGGGGAGGGPATPGPGGPSAPGPSGPGAPGASTPGAPAGAPGGGAAPSVTGGGDLGEDLTRWDYWWGFNKDPYLNLKANIHGGGVATGSDEFFLGRGEKEQAKNTMAPSEADIREKVVPALKAALKNERGNDILTGSLIALAKIGDVKDESGESEFEGIIKAFLKDSNQEVAETAATALGILANDASVQTLVDLMNDDPAARKFIGKTEVPPRTRSFAAYGLGLIGYRTADNAVRQTIAEHLVDVLTAPSFSTRDIKVAAMTAYGLTPVDFGDVELSEDEAKSNRKHAINRTAQLNFLKDYFDEENQRANSSTRHWFVRSHAPAAMARLLSDSLTEPKTAQLRTDVIDLLKEGIGKHSKLQKELQQSCILALGQVGTASGEKEDKEVRDELVRTLKDGGTQMRRFALISLAQMAGREGPGEAPWGGTDAIRSELMTRMSKGKSRLKPWAGLSLGVLGRALIEAGESPSSNASNALRDATSKEKSPTEAGAYMIGVGLRNDLQSADMLREKLDFFSVDETRGHAAVALGLMNDANSVTLINDIIKNSAYRPPLLKQAAVALGLLGDKSVVPDLVTMLSEAKGLATQAAISSALGAIGDSRSLDPLVGMLGNSTLTQSARGFAAVALGIVCDKEDFPWNSKISTNTNYRANTVTLTGESGTGILDIL
jgi:HEAT repeat protein